MHLKEIGCGSVYWLHLGQDTTQHWGTSWAAKQLPTFYKRPSSTWCYASQHIKISHPCNKPSCHQIIIGTSTP